MELRYGIDFVSARSKSGGAYTAYWLHPELGQPMQFISVPQFTIFGEGGYRSFLHRIYLTIVCKTEADTKLILRLKLSLFVMVS